jgi:reductive dehalogenase
MEVVLIGWGAGWLLFFFAAGITSMLEGEKRAAIVSFLSGMILSIPFLLPGLNGITYPVWLSALMASLAASCLALLLIPLKGRIPYSFQRPARRIDERDTMFSRWELEPGSKRFKDHYNRRPQHLVPDEKFRSRPGWLHPGSRCYDPVLFAATRSIFKEIETLYPRVDGEPAQPKLESSPSSFTDSVLGMARKLGALASGITPLYDYHVYSVGGRGDRYGKEFTVRHKFAIALIVEMDHRMMRAAPAAPTVVESARQYYRVGKMAVELGGYIRSCGYEARAHIDANYQVVCPLVARDAGLGEIGRMGLLMTPSLGPRVRIAVVTTNMPLLPSRVIADPAVADFCRRCEKCAMACPGRAIPFGHEPETGDVRRWRVSSENCYTYWCQAGTDCGRCVIVCPFSHPDNWFHRLVRHGIRNSLIFRRLAIPLDDLFYGRKPRPRHPASGRIYSDLKL